jgi:hypothetical protein
VMLKKDFRDFRQDTHISNKPLSNSTKNRQDEEGKSSSIALRKEEFRIKTFPFMKANNNAMQATAALLIIRRKAFFMVLLYIRMKQHFGQLFFYTVVSLS